MESRDLVMGLIGLAVTLLSALIVSVWRFSALATTLSAAVSNLKDDIREIRTSVEAIKMIPIIVQRLDQVELVVSKITSVRPKSHHDIIPGINE